MWSQFSDSSGQKRFLKLTKFCPIQGYCILKRTLNRAPDYQRLSDEDNQSSNIQTGRYTGYCGGRGGGVLEELGKQLK